MSQVEKLLAIARQKGVLHSQELKRLGIHRETLRRLVQKGILTRPARGIYTLVDFDLTEHHSLAEVARRLPHGIICLLSALEFHDLTTQLPHQVWVALDRQKRYVPREEWLPLSITYMSGEAFSEGVETHDIEGVTVPVYGVAKTIVDCFKFRNKIGLDVALEALRQGWQERRFTMSELSRYARICRMSRVMQPYLEFLQ